MIMLHVVFSFWLKLLAKTFLILLLLLKRKMMPVLLCKVNSVLRNFHLLPERIGIFFTILTGCNMAKKMGTVTNSVPTFFFLYLYILYFSYVMCIFSIQISHVFLLVVVHSLSVLILLLILFVLELIF